MAKFLFLFGAFFLIATSAEAMCVYNKSPVPVGWTAKGMAVSVEFNCTEPFCGTRWTIDAGDHKCYPNKGGTVHAGVGGKYDGCSANVHPHGTVTVKRTPRLSCESGN